MVAWDSKFIINLSLKKNSLIFLKERNRRNVLDKNPGCYS